jgi:probable rRNA maturation factor
MNQILVSAEEKLGEICWLEKIEPFAQKILAELGADGKEISIFFCSDEYIQFLNENYRKINSPTDVLSFENGMEYTDESGRTWIQAGDIAISLETLPKNAEYFEVSRNEELKRLIVHGILHLSGYDHGDEHVEKNSEPVCEMLVLQKKIMESLKDEILI